MKVNKFNNFFFTPYILESYCKGDTFIKTQSRNTQITNCFLDQQFEIHNGKTFIKLKITKEMIGYKLGEFVPTRKKFSFKKKKHGSKNKS